MAPRNFTDEQEQEIAKLYLSGMSVRAIARMHGLGHHISISSALRRQGVKQRPPAERNRLYSLDPYIFDEINDEHTAYWLGFIYADGCVNRRTLSVALKASDKKYLTKLKGFLKSEAPIHNYIRNEKYKVVGVDFTDRHLARRLRELGIVTGRTKPDNMLSQIPNHLVQHWIRGLFDGDGAAHKNKAISFCGSYRLMEFVRSALHRQAGANPDLAISKHRTAKIYYLRFSGRRVALNIADYMYQNSTVWMERKRNVIESWPEPSKRERDEKGRYI